MTEASLLGEWSGEGVNRVDSDVSALSVAGVSDDDDRVVNGDEAWRAAGATQRANWRATDATAGAIVVACENGGQRGGTTASKKGRWGASQYVRNGIGVVVVVVVVVVAVAAAVAAIVVATAYWR
jgi:hypothetical protein